MIKNTESLDSLIKLALRNKSDTIDLPPGIHHIYPDGLDREERFISNNDSGVKSILFNLKGVENLVVAGHGAELVMHGRIMPFSLLNSKNITLRNFSIDWDRKFMTPGKVLKSEKNMVEVKFPSEYPVKAENGKLIFHGSHYCSEKLGNVLEYCPNKKESAYKCHDNYGVRNNYSAEDLGSGIFRIRGTFKTQPSVGNELIFKHEERLSPAIAIAGCENVRLENIDIYHCGGMGVIAQCSRNLYLDNVNVKLREGSNDTVSITADASHFVDCEGDIRILNCLFENQQDDPCNIHGIYRRVTGKPAPDTLEIALGHCQQFGVETIRPGDPLGFYDTRTFELLFESKAKSIEQVTPGRSILTLTDILADLNLDNLAVMKKQHDVNVLIKGCTFRNNRARGLLISTLGKVLIEDNYFHVPGSAILIEGDSNFWFESGPVEELEIRNNFFDNCNYGVWGKALIDITPQIKPEHRGIPFHKNVRIHHNRIKYFHRPLIHAHSVENLEFYNNELMESKDYPVSDDTIPLFELGKAVATGKM